MSGFGHLLGGQMLMDGGRLQLCGCCGPSPGCIPPAQPICTCSNGAGCGTRACQRLLVTQGMGPSTIIRNEPYIGCCGGPQQWAIQGNLVYLDKGECNGLCVRKRYEFVGGGGYGAGSVRVNVYGASGVGSCGLELQAQYHYQTAALPCSPLALSRAVCDELFGANQNHNALGIYNLYDFQAPGAPIDTRTGHVYADCTASEERLWMGFLNTTNPCAGVAVFTEVYAQTFSPNCAAPGTTCGACCCGGRCYEPVTPERCALMGGLFRGPGSSCVGVVCPGDPRTRGACCHPITGTCRQTDRAECAGYGGTFLGENIPCMPGLCSDGRWACCVNGICADDRTLAECKALGGEWFPGSPCTAQLCDLVNGACCYPPGICDDTGDAATCTGQGGTWMGGQTTCQQVQCGTGACCSQTSHGATCTMETQQSCADVLGTFFGYGVCCAGPGCPVGIVCSIGDAGRTGPGPRSGPIRIATGAETIAVMSGRNPLKSCRGCGDDIGI